MRRSAVFCTGLYLLCVLLMMQCLFGKVFDGDHYGSALKLHFEDEMSGPTTLNPGIVSFDETGANIEISMRYSVTYPFEEKITAAQSELQNYPFTLDVAGNSKPHYVSEEDELVQTLLEVYRKRKVSENHCKNKNHHTRYARCNI